MPIVTDQNQISQDSVEDIEFWAKPALREKVTSKINTFMIVFCGLGAKTISPELKTKLSDIETYLDCKNPDLNEIKNNLPQDICVIENILKSKQISDPQAKLATRVLVEELRSITPPTIMYSHRKKYIKENIIPITSPNFMLDSTESYTEERCKFSSCVIL